MAQKKDYLEFDKTVSLILAIIPVTSYILGIITRFQEGKVVAAVLRIFFGWIAYWVDLYKMLTEGSIWRWLDK